MLSKHLTSLMAHIPASDGRVFAVSAQAALGLLKPNNYTTQPVGRTSFTSPSPGVRMAF
ncbi:hypothetical protein [Litoreibacter roseus]|nr:hypothetical protein [Litoreibacter roseus]